MALSQDDLPRSPTGRVPQWVVDEAAGRRPESEQWRSPTAVTSPAPVGRAPRRRRRLWLRLVDVLIAAALGWWLVTGVLPGVLRNVDVPWLDSIVMGRVPEPTTEVAALADDMLLTDHGRDLFYVARPTLLGADEFAGRCDRASLAVRADGPVACYTSTGRTLLASRPSIVLYVPADPRLRGFVVESAAHELLHAGWDDLTDTERASATPLLEAVVAGLDPQDGLHAQLAGSVGADPSSRGTELFAYVGTQVLPPGGLDPMLEALYAQFIRDRGGLVAVHTGFESMLAAMADDVDAAQSALDARSVEHQAATAAQASDVASLALYRSEIERQEAYLAGLSAAQQSRWRLSWTWRDGTVLPMAPAARTLADARDLLVRDEAALTAQAVALEAAAADLALEQTRVDGLRRDLDGLWAQLDPGQWTVPGT